MILLTAAGRAGLRHSAITFALDAGAALRDVQDYAGHKDPAVHPAV